MIKKERLASSWAEAMRVLFEKAEFAAAAAVYDDALADGAKPGYDEVFLRGRIALKHDQNEGVAFLIRHPPKMNAGQQRGEWALLLATGYGRMHDFERADHYFEIAEQSLKTPARRAQIAYQRARRFMLEGRLDDARRVGEEMSCDRSLATMVAQETLRSFILSQEERYREEAESLIRALDLIGKHRASHLEQWFHAVQNLALLGRELCFDEAAARAKREVDDEQVVWPEDFRAQQFQALKAVGWSCALRGDLLGCFRYLRAAEQNVPSAAFEAIVLVDRAYFARLVGEPNWAANELATADAIAERVDWNALAGEERVGLLLLAEAMAETNPEKARFYLASYKNLDRIRSPLHLFAFDDRCDAFAAYAEGVVRLKSGAGAEEALRRAWVTFDRIGYDWRAGRTALRLLEVTKKERWRLLAEDKLEHYPRSWLAREIVTTVKATPKEVRLPRMQRTVLDLLCQKMTTAEIAARLGLSQHTIRNHLKVVFRAYAVNSRAALVAEVANRGQMPVAAGVDERS